jgi:hypothetical protein
MDGPSDSIQFIRYFYLGTSEHGIFRGRIQWNSGNIPRTEPPEDGTLLLQYRLHLWARTQYGRRDTFKLNMVTNGSTVKVLWRLTSATYTLLL